MMPTDIPPAKNPSHRHRPHLIVGMIVVVLTGVIVGSGLWYKRNLKAVQPGDETAQLVRIESGMSSAEIAASLKDQGLIKNTWAFRIYLRLSGVSDEIQIGLYRLNPSLSTQEVTRRLASGETAVHSLTIIPGMRLAAIKQELVQIGYQEADIDTALSASYPYSVLEDKPASATLEGYLYPETYVVELDTPVEQLIDLILSVTDERVKPEIRQGWAGQGLNIYEGITLASIVQKEDSVAKNQAQIAQVFFKRLAIGRKLEADPTFEYGAFLLNATPSTSVDSPYNTYLYEGLPPGPIANPDSNAMEAVADPADTDWLFFLHDKDGGIHFSDSEDKHKQNIEEYLN